MNAAKKGDLHVGVVLGDPNLPYPYSVDGRFGEPVTAGNIIGGGGLVALVYWFVYLRPARG